MLNAETMSDTSTGPSIPDKLTKLLALLPTGTFLAFSTIVPITTNYGHCSVGEKAATAVLVFVFAFTCAFTSFTDSYVAPGGSMWYGVVTRKGLWNPFFGSSGLAGVNGWTYEGGGAKYIVKVSDVYVMVLSTVSFLTLTLMSSSLTDCFYSHIDGTVLKAIPLPINFFVGVAFAFAPPARHSVGFAFGTSSTSPKEVEQ